MCVCVGGVAYKCVFGWLISVCVCVCVLGGWLISVSVRVAYKCVCVLGGGL